MHDFSRIRRNFSELRCCVIIPTYNNDQTLEMVIEDIQGYTPSIIIVNDGSTDNTPAILNNYPHLHILNIPENKGKGNALRTGFHYAIKNGFRYAITIDSDGQHFPADMPDFLDWIRKDPDSLIIGARNMDQSEVPGTSSFGHKFSIFWYRIETGLKIPDVQSGFRLYPLEKIGNMKFYTTKYEFEVEVLVRAAWRGIPILSLPVNVYYAPKEQRVSHFRKFRDFARVSLVNIILVLMAILLVRPIQFFKDLRKKSIRQFIREYVIDSKDSNLKITSSVALGLFVGVLPIWGWQMMAAFGLSHFLKLNKFVTLAAANISIPPLIPFIIFLSYFSGKLILGPSTSHLVYSPGLSIRWIKENLLQYLVGSFIFGLFLAVILGAITYLLLHYFRKRIPGIVKD
ncbi:MAG: DUF2062 domain-containing protein [Bacteroidetes bacterium]|nr:DUF2062 domain-containing protein [Bacteroidota bacterium]